MHNQVLTAEEMSTLMANSRAQGLLPLLTIYEKPKDFPRQFVGRVFIVGHPAKKAPIATNKILLADTLEAIKSQIPPDLTCLKREIGDDPRIVETWL